MKKIILSTMILAAAGFATATANVQTHAVVAFQQEEKKAVKAEELPDAVKGALAGDDYKEWKLEKAFHVKPATGTEHYEIELKKGEETKTVKLDKDGKVVA